MEIRSVSVIGAGLMGMGIAQVCARFGYNVVIRDLTGDILDRALASSRSNLEGQVSKGRITLEEVAQVFTRISPTTKLEDAATADLIIEAIVEDTGAKRELFAYLDTIAPSSSIFATNTSILSPTEIGAATKRPDKTLGLHFFNPAPVMKLVEVTSGQLTSQETLEACMDFCRTIGKTPVLVNEFPGGIVSRILIAMRNEAVDCLADGVASMQDIDTAMKLGAGMPMGPFELIDLIGVDLMVTNADSMVRETGNPKYRPHPLLRKMTRAGLFGRKSGRGFYNYDK
jgi:3-hydroxybutyryl-CoA dehydrogenase